MGQQKYANVAMANFINVMFEQVVRWRDDKNIDYWNWSFAMVSRINTE